MAQLAPEAQAPRGLNVAPLPTFARMGGAIAEALPSLAPLARVRVSEVAPRRMIESGGHWVPWRPDVAPYMTEPMDATMSRRFDSVAFVGPARSSKSEALVMNTLAHAVLAQPRMVAVFSPSKDAAQEWSMGALDPMILHSPELADRLARGKGGDNVFSKRFRGGARLTIDWPVPAKLAQRSIALVIGTDYDAFPADIGGDGEAFALMRKRTESAGSRGMVVVESSPRRPILDETWTPATPHQAPPCEGIVGIYNTGSRARLYWGCPDCGHRFVPEFDLLRWPDAGSPAEKGAAAHMACPDCGSVIEARRKQEMNAGAVWLHEEADGTAVPLEALERRVATASYWLPGPAAALAPWERLVARYLEAEAAQARSGDEGALKAVMNIELGLPYLPRSLLDGDALSARTLRAQATAHDWGAAPAETAFVTVAVDVQKGRFVVQVEAWALDLSRVVIDRFDLVAPPAGAARAGERALDPGRHAEDWEVLAELAERAWPVTGGDHALRAVAIVIDAGGAPGVTPNAYGFWRAMARRHPRRFHLVRGRGGDRAKRAEVRRPETAHQGRHHVARDVRLIWAGTDRLKDEIAASLGRAEGGARKLSLPAGAPEELFEEYAAERRGAKGWEKRRGVQRNEALDLSVYALALAIVMEAEALDRDNPPLWARPGPGNQFAVASVGGFEDLPTEAAPSAPAARGWVVRRPGGGRR